MPNKRDPQYWVGEFIKKEDSVFIFDPALQDDASPWVYLFRIDKHRILKYKKDFIRGHVQKASDIYIIERAIEIYGKWDSVVGKKLKTFGVFNQEHKHGNGKHVHRESHCWHCKEPLDNDFDIECKKCGWIICPVCGACDYDCIGSSIKLPKSMLQERKKRDFRIPKSHTPLKELDDPSISDADRAYFKEKYNKP